MAVRPRTIALLAGLGIAVVVATSALVEAAGHEAAVAVALAAIALLIGSYVSTVVIAVRSFGKEDARDRMLRWGRVQLVFMFITPLVLIAAHPWGMATFAVLGAVLILQPLFAHGMVIVGLIVQRRRTSDTGSERLEGS
jgi:hypothetical protein